MRRLLPAVVSERKNYLPAASNSMGFLHGFIDDNARREALYNRGLKMTARPLGTLVARSHVAYVTHMIWTWFLI